MRAASIPKTTLAVVILASTLTLAGCSEDAPTTPTPVPTTATVTFASNLALMGSSSRSFEVTRAGTVSVTLISVGGSSTLSVGLGIGIPLGDGSGCVLSSSVESVPGATAQLEQTVDVGDFCVQVYDPGTLLSAVAFTLNIIYPV